ncbi:DUF952 domain-containing protein [Aquipuribacter nitratireducens]|uniref:DUF952 domain-containing protein n=1 Tax=Aquipuribacter nitratireducens TaxID=650104 RepID=A0ABW0GT53_9MICO
MRPLFHLAVPDDWVAAQATGRYERSTRGASLADVGFVHCSWMHQVDEVAAAVFADWDGELLLLQIDASRVGAPVREEDLAGVGERFPHVYGPLPVEAVERVRRMVRVDGAWRLQ